MPIEYNLCDEEILLAFKAGVSARELGRELGVSRQPILRRLRLAGVPIGEARPYVRYPKGPHILTSRERQILLGSVLGDATLYAEGRRVRPRFIEAHAKKQAPYLRWKAIELKRLNPKVHLSDRGHTTLATSSLLVLQPWWREFYPDKPKVIPKTRILELEPLGLAVWYMDDGNYHNRQLATHGFTFDDNEWLASEFFPQQFKLHPHVMPCRWINGKKTEKPTSCYLYFPSAEFRLFIKIVKPFMHSCLQYKVGQ